MGYAEPHQYAAAALRGRDLARGCQVLKSVTEEELVTQKGSHKREEMRGLEEGIVN